MRESLRLMCVLAHPDDESLGTGGILVKYAAEGAETYVVTATRGEHGWAGDPADYPGPAKLGQIRERELRDAANVLGVREIKFLDYIDGLLDEADPAEVINQIVAHLRRVRPQVVVTFDPNGAYGHPDHIAIAQFTTAALVAAADPSTGYGRPHRVAKLYYRGFRPAEVAAYEAAFGDLVMQVDGGERRFTAWPDWALTTWIDTSDYWAQVWEAVTCHRSQLSNYQALQALPEEHHANLWGTQTYYRALSLVNGGRAIEHDLFAGLHAPSRLEPVHQHRNGVQTKHPTPATTIVK